MKYGNQICPVCGGTSLIANGLKIDLLQTLARWETAMKMAFPQEVWAAYKDKKYDSLTLIECKDCGYGYFDPVVTGSADFYQAISFIDYYNAEKWEFDCAVEDLKNFGAKRILDVGCGSGVFLNRLKASIQGAELFGYDLNEDLINQLSKQGFGVLPSDPQKFSYALEDAPLFDAICMLQVIEHVADPISFMNIFLKYLKPGGLVVITTPDAAGPISKFPEALTEIPPHHVTRWTKQTHEALLAHFGATSKRILNEPLPDYLWDAYLPVMWDKSIWPVQVFDQLALARGLESLGDRSAFAAQAMKSVGIRRLHGVPGHTIYVSACVKEQV